MRTLKTTGTLVYSTCTLEPDENEGVITYLLEKFKNAKLEDIDIVNSKEFEDHKKHIASGITHWSGNQYNTLVKKCIRVIPSSEMMGFFIAKIKKV